MPPTCTPEKKNEFDDSTLASKAYFTLEEDNPSPIQQPYEEKDDLSYDEIVHLRRTFPDLRLFTLHRQVGFGTFSTVYLASLRSNAEKRFALKHIVPTCHPDRIKFELQCLKDIGGTDNVAGISLCLRNYNDVLLIMPYQPHDFFNDYIGNMDIAEVKKYMKNLLIAIARVHSFGVVHRDIKPSNFLYDRKNGRFMLVDFGLAHSVAGDKITSRKRKRESPGSDDLSQPLKKLTDSPCILGMSQKENDPTNKIKEGAKVDKKSPNLFVRSTKIEEKPQNSCRCYGKGKTCTGCVTRQSLRALRAGTPGFRPPEVLLKSVQQDTGIDIWAAGIIMLSIVSNCCNFFSSPDDMTALAEMMLVFGSEEIKKIAHQYGRHLICSEVCPSLDLRKICRVLRARNTLNIHATKRDKCKRCQQLESYCLCSSTALNEEFPDEFDDSTYDLLQRLLDINNRSRITAAEALKHPFLRDA